jgi:integrase
VNARTGKRYLSAGYAPSTINHQLAVLVTFYEFHRHFGRGPVVSPVPAASRDGARPNAHGNPMFPVMPHRRAAYRQKVPERAPRALSDELWTELFASLRCHRYRAILATYISSGVRASELLGMTCGDVDFGQQTITVVGKGTRLRQVVPVSPDALVWRLRPTRRRPTGKRSASPACGSIWSDRGGCASIRSTFGTWKAITPFRSTTWSPCEPDPLATTRGLRAGVPI